MNVTSLFRYKIWLGGRTFDIWCSPADVVFLNEYFANSEGRQVVRLPRQKRADT